MNKLTQLVRNQFPTYWGFPFAFDVVLYMTIVAAVTYWVVK